MKKIKYPSIYEINTRVWLKRFDRDGGEPTLSSVPENYWNSMKSLGIDYIWLMGVWHINPESVERYCFEEFLQKEYSKALPDWRREDVVGSPYSIDSYTVSEKIGGEGELLELKEKLNRLGMGLILDFIPNHFSAGSSLLGKSPGLFLEAEEADLTNDPDTYFKSQFNGNVFAHGRDPMFPAWKDTAQLNYFNGETREFMTGTLKDLTRLCDGVRCDMAMLVLNRVFASTWEKQLKSKNLPETEFWETAISETKKLRQEFLFIAEAYWDLEWELQQLGFDYTYDKKLTDRLISGYVPDISGHLDADEDYRNRSLRFLENHDEERAVVSLGEERSQAAALITATLPGMRFFNDGQFEGKSVKLPVQLGREPDEAVNENIKKFYSNLLKITNSEVFKSGEWTKLNPRKTSDIDNSASKMLAWLWSYKNSHALVVVNYSDCESYCFLKFEPGGFSDEVKFIDELNSVTYIRSADEIRRNGLFIKLEPFQSHIFRF